LLKTLKDLPVSEASAGLKPRGGQNKHPLLGVFGGFSF